MMRKQTEVLRAKKQSYNLAIFLFSPLISIVLHTELLSFDFKLMHFVLFDYCHMLVSAHDTNCQC